MTTAQAQKRAEKKLQQLRTLPSNKTCVHCGAVATDVEMKYGIFICARCGGVHREFPGTFRVKSISASSFKPEEVDFVATKGNEAVTTIYLAKWTGKNLAKPKSQPWSKVEVKRWIQDVYVDRVYFDDSPERVAMAEAVAKAAAGISSGIAGSRGLTVPAPPSGGAELPVAAPAPQAQVQVQAQASPSSAASGPAMPATPTPTTPPQPAAADPFSLSPATPAQPPPAAAAANGSNGWSSFGGASAATADPFAPAPAPAAAPAAADPFAGATASASAGSASAGSGTAAGSNGWADFAAAAAPAAAPISAPAPPAKQRMELPEDLFSMGTAPAYAAAQPVVPGGGVHMGAMQAQAMPFPPQPQPTGMPGHMMIPPAAAMASPAAAAFSAPPFDAAPGMPAAYVNPGMPHGYVGAAYAPPPRPQGMHAAMPAYGAYPHPGHVPPNGFAQPGAAPPSGPGWAPNGAAVASAGMGGGGNPFGSGGGGSGPDLMLGYGAGKQRQQQDDGMFQDLVGDLKATLPSQHSRAPAGAPMGAGGNPFA